MMIAATLDYEIISSIRSPKNQVDLNKIVKNVLEKRYSKKFSDLITKMMVINGVKKIYDKVFKRNEELKLLEASNRMMDSEDKE